MDKDTEEMLDLAVDAVRKAGEYNDSKIYLSAQTALLLIIVRLLVDIKEKKTNE